MNGLEGKRIPRMLGWSIAYILILLSTMLPLVNLLTIALVMIPVLVMYVRMSTKPFVAHYAISLAVVYLITSLWLAPWLGVFLVALSVFFLPPVIQMGNLYKKRATARTVLTAGVVTLLAELLLSFVVIHLMGLNPVGRMKQFMIESVETLPPQLQGLMGIDVDELVQIMVQLLPLYMIGFSLFYIIVTHWLARKALVRMGESLPAFRAVKDWMLPRSFIWLYLIGLLLEMFVRDSRSVVFSVILNLLPLLMMAFSVQAIAFLFYVAHIKGWNKTLPIAGIIILLMFPVPAYFLFSLLGVFDVAFPLRDRLTARK
ncbi:DUF2232 domain-containing protein [Paenibacillus mucilaginosus]|uniref:DUF2232 domain-containing protein n=1 Tax=Paenibacillus mucilaginosus TaxID=61624 RepID=UPI003D1968D7